MLNDEIRYDDPRYDDYSRVAQLMQCCCPKLPAHIGCNIVAQYVKEYLLAADKAQYDFFNFVPVESAEGFEHLPQSVRDALEEINNRDRLDLERRRDYTANTLQLTCELYLLLQKTGDIYVNQLKQFLK